MNSDRLTVNVCHVADMDGEGRQGNGKEGRVGGGGAEREGRLFENVARGGGPPPKMWPGAPSHLNAALTDDDHMVVTSYS